MSDPLSRLNDALEGRYRVERKLGEGGMATVWLARDEKHNRQVALKVLKPELAAIVGAERFLAEIETTANLQHPHILPLFDSGQADTFLYYVMPYVEGPSLREHLREEQQLPVEKALELARKVASALSYAHDEGVVHRDIKPANILLSRGEPLVADFGIALALSEAGGGRITETGLSMGTPHYMSPEQASGERTLDRRTDVYALGCVLYEMLTGQPPFPGPNAQAVLGRILTGDPTPPSELRRTIPTHVDHALSKALERVPADRFATADDFVAGLDDPTFRHGLDDRGRRVVAASGPGPWKAVALGAGVLAIALAGLLGLGFAQGPAETPTVRQQVVLWEIVDGVPPWAVSRLIALDPSGHAIVYPDTVEGRTAPTLHYKAASETSGIVMPGTFNVRAPALSPDGDWVAYMTTEGELRKQPVTGGTSVLVADSAGGGSVAALDWLDDGTLVFEAADFTIRRIGNDGTDEEVLATREEVGGAIEIVGLVGSGGALVVGCPTSGCPPGVSQLSLVHFGRDTVVHLGDEVTGVGHLPGDRVVYVDPRGAAYLSYLDLDALTLSPPTPLFDGVATNEGAAQLVLARNGNLLYRAGEYGAGNLQLLWLDDTGRPVPLQEGWTLEALTNMDVSPDGDRLALVIADDEGSDQVWVKELPAGPLSPLTFGPDRHIRPRWIDGGESVAFVTVPADTGTTRFAGRIVADGSSRTVDTVATHPLGVYEVRQAPAGWILRVGTTDDDTADIVYQDASGDVVPLLDSGFDERSPSLSPDGRWLAYVSSRSGASEVYVRPFPDEGPRRQVSTSGGWEPQWTPEGRLVYTNPDSLYRATIDPQSGTVESRELLFARGAWVGNTAYPRSAIHPTDGRLLVQGARQGSEQDQNRLIYVQNLLAEIEALEARR